MGTLLLAVVLTAGILYGLYQIPYFQNNIKHWGEGKSYYNRDWNDDNAKKWWNEEERPWAIALPIVGFFFIWLIVFCFARTNLVERYEKWEDGVEIMSYDYDGLNPDQFVVGRDGSYYYVLVKDGEGFKEEYYSISGTQIKKSGARSPHLEEKHGWKKVKKSERPGMFFNKEDIRKKTGCGCSEVMLYVPPSFTFKDKE